MNRAHSPDSTSSLHAAIHTVSLSEPSRRRLPEFLLLLFLAALGFVGCTESMYSLYQLDCNLLFVRLLSGGVFLLSCLLQRFSKSGGICTAIGVILVVLLLLLRSGSTTAGMQYLLNAIYQQIYHTDTSYFTVKSDLYPESSAVLQILLCLSILLAFFFSYFTVRRPQFLLTAGLSFLLLEPGLYFGLELSPLAMAPLLSYWCSMFAMRLILRRTQQITSNEALHKTVTSSGAWIAFLVLAVFGTVTLLGAIFDYTRSESDRQRKQQLTTFLSEFRLQNMPEILQQVGTSLGIYNDPEVKELGTKSSLEYQNTKMLSLEFDILPQEALYLKGYTGSTYQNNCWYSSDDTTEIENSATVKGIIQTYDCAPQNFPFLFQQSMDPDAKQITCTVTQLEEDNFAYAPYVAFSSEASYADDVSWTPQEKDTCTWIISQSQETLASLLAQERLGNRVFTAPEENSDTAVQGFLQSLGLKAGSVTAVSCRFPLEQSATEPTEIQGKVIPAVLLESFCYRSYAKDAYTALPEEAQLQKVYEALPDSIVNQKNPKTPEEQLALLYDLRKWMASCTTYTTSPGETPEDQDFINFFLLENQKGYCVHYATAGTVLARYLGIPARYCEGYLAGTDTLETATETDSGATVTLTDRQAHAWCEFYIDGYGWVPFEMTPGFYSDVDIEVVSPEVTESAIETTDTIVTTEENHVPETKKTEPVRSLLPIFWKIFGALGSILALWGILVLLRLLCRFRWRRRCQDMQHPQRAVMTAYGQLLRLLRFYGIPWHGQLLLTYQEAAATALRRNSLPEEAVNRLIPLALATELGNKTPVPEEIAAAITALEQLEIALYQSYPLWKRFCMKYLFHLV